MSLAVSPIQSPPYTNLIDGGRSVDQQQHSSSHSFSSMDRLKPSIIIITLILFITLLLSISICLLLRHLNRRCLRHLSGVSASSVSADSRRVSTSTRRVSPETPTADLTTPPSSVIQSLPVFKYSSITRRSIAGGDCAVCLSKFEPQDQLRLLPLCCHAFHADCIDTWLESNLTCPLCRSAITASESDVLKAVNASSRANDSFRLEIGSISRRRQADGEHSQGRTYSLGSFDYVVEEDSDVTTSQTYRISVSDKEEPVTDSAGAALEPNLASEVASGRNWLKDYVDRLSHSLSSRTFSFRSSGRFFTGSSRRNDVVGVAEYDMESNLHVGEEISELFRWISGL